MLADPSVEGPQCRGNPSAERIPVPGGPGARRSQCGGIPVPGKDPSAGRSQYQGNASAGGGGPMSADPHLSLTCRTCPIPRPLPSSPLRATWRHLQNCTLMVSEIQTSWKRSWPTAPSRARIPPASASPPGRRTGGAARGSPISHLIPIPVPPPSRGISGHRSGCLMPSHGGRDGSADVGLTTATAEPCGGPRALREPGSSRPHRPRGPALQPQSRGPGSLQSTGGSRTISGIKPPP